MYIYIYIYIYIMCICTHLLDDFKSVRLVPQTRSDCLSITQWLQHTTGARVQPRSFWTEQKQQKLYFWNQETLAQEQTTPERSIMTMHLQISLGGVLMWTAGYARGWELACLFCAHVCVVCMRVYVCMYVACIQKVLSSRLCALPVCAHIHTCMYLYV